LLKKERKKESKKERNKERNLMAILFEKFDLPLKHLQDFGVRFQRTSQSLNKKAT